MSTPMLSGYSVHDGEDTLSSEALQVGRALACFNHWICETKRGIKAVGRRAIH